MQINTFPLIRGLASYVLPESLFHRPGSGGTFSSQYCYSVWLRHLSYLRKLKFIQDLSQIQSVAEIGPGDSLGIGLCALYTGANQYHAFDVIEHTNLSSNLLINDDLREYFKTSMVIPSGEGFQNVNPPLLDYSFPGWLTREASYYDSRHVEIQKALKGLPSEVEIDYVVPWTKGQDRKVSNVDLIFSQAVMEHVADIDFAYCEMFKWLRPGGLLSHQVDFKTHEMTKEWNGHWFIPPNLWSILAHGRKYPMNRLPLSGHLNSIENAGFKILAVVPVKRHNTFAKAPLIDGIDFTADDLVTSSALIQAIKE